MRSSKAWVSLWIVLAVGLHAVPIVLRQRQNQTTWPWLTWAMYKDSRPAGPIVGERRRLSGVTETGVRSPSTRTRLGSASSWSTGLFVRPWLLGDTTAAPRLFAHLNQRRRDPLVEIRLSVETYTVTDSGTAVRKRTLSYEPDVTGAR